MCAVLVCDPCEIYSRIFLAERAFEKSSIDPQKFVRFGSTASVLVQPNRLVLTALAHARMANILSSPDDSSAY